MMTPSLQIQQTSTLTGLRSHRPELQIRQQSPDLHINQDHHGLVEISTTAGRMYIDQTEAFADANLVPALRQNQEYLASGNKKAAQFIARTVQQGDQMMQIENGTGALARISKVNSETPEKQATLGYMPRSMDRVKFQYQPSDVSIRVNPKPVDIQIDRKEVQVDIPKWQTDTYIRQKNQISFQVVGSKVNLGI
ncbi:DUF6470 family protein [Halalkalibacter okhensis]|uniref:Uncharacterized protein n=1 Tax=Halalkalibacter okhensis TaxID=333138 RepID=A0A0B0IAL7_9BACI|nr:DUF6470 family protein [Halalkalibacter okhensis]KHF39623.1 hypothetical protein LQ50_14405 [Halalkalibacter okhensis]